MIARGPVPGSLGWATERLAMVPEKWQADFRAKFEQKRKPRKWPFHKYRTELEAQNWLEAVSAPWQSIRLPLNASDSDICALADKCAGDCMSLASLGGDVVALRARMDRFCEGWGVVPPKRLEGAAGYEDRPAIARMTDAQWWRRRLRVAHARAAELEAIRLGYVSARRRSPYCSDEAFQRRAQQRKRNAAMLEATEAQSEDGEILKLSELWAASNANPVIRRGELMIRASGFDLCAISLGHVCEFVTTTCPPRMHARRHESGEENPTYDGTSPKAAQEYQARNWARCRSAMARAGIEVYGIRVAEPHHDGCPHWHMLMYMAPMVKGRQTVPLFRRLVRRYWLNADDAEIATKKELRAQAKASGMRGAGAAEWVNKTHRRERVQRVRQRYARQLESGEIKRRVEFRAVDLCAGQGGGGAAYLAKYISKNIDGYGIQADLLGMPIVTSAGRVEAWAAHWGIRQFQQIGGPGVGVWRELRRIKEASVSPVIEWARDAAGIGRQKLRGEAFASFIEIMGGPVLPRKERPISVARVAAYRELDGKLYGRPGKYGEVGTDIVGVVDLSEVVAYSARKVWTVARRKIVDLVKQGGNALLSRAPWRAYGKPSEVDADGIRFGSVGFSPPWTRVNNCTGVESESDGKSVAAEKRCAQCAEFGGGAAAAESGARLDRSHGVFDLRNGGGT